MTPPWPRSVRARLALWHGLALLLVVSVYAVAVLLQVRDDLYEELDAQLASDLALAGQWLARTDAEPAGALPADALQQPGPGDAPELPWVEAWSADGRRVATAGRRPTLPETAPPTGPRGRPETMRVPLAGPVRVLVGTTTLSGQPALVRVGRSERTARVEIREFATALGLSLPLAFAFAAGAGYWLARRALAPVAEMTARARQITAERLEDRLPVANPDDEFGQLATVINGALARLERSFTLLRRFTADASHELRTPLTAIRSVGEVGLRGRHDESAYREIVGSVLEETDRLTTMVDGLLTLSRADAGKFDLHPAAVDLGALARDVADDLGVLAEEKRQRLDVHDAGPATAWSDRATLRQAVINLVDNAIKHGPEGTAIRLVARANGAEAVLEVADEGPGIAPEHLPHVFERFYRADRSRTRAEGGAGLGLSIAQWAVEANGGRIEVESEVGRGSVFRIVLPAAR